MKQRITCLLVMVIYLLLSAPVIGAQQIVISKYVSEYSSSNVPQAQRYGDGTGTYGFAMSADKKEYVKFNFDIPSSGRYKISINVAADNAGVTLMLDGKNIITKRLNTGGFFVLSQEDMATSILVKGQHEIGVIVLGEQNLYEACMVNSVTVVCEELLVIEQEQLNAGDFKAHNDSTPNISVDPVNCNEYELYEGTGMMLLEESEWSIYDAELSKSGSYSISVNCALFDSAVIKLSVDERTYDYTLVRESADLKNFIISDAELVAGTHEVKLEVCSGGAVLLQNITINSIADFAGSEITIKPDGYTTVVGNTFPLNVGNQVWLLAVENSRLTYALNNISACNYMLSLDMISQTTAAELSVSVNGRPQELLTVEKGDGSAQKRMVLLNLSGVSDILKLEVTKGDILLYDFTLTPFSKLSAKGAQSFTEEMNRITTYEQTEQVLNLYLPYLDTNLAEITEGVFYPQIIYDTLIKGEYKNINELLSTFYMAAKKERETPSVALYDAQQNLLTKLQTGDLTVKIKNKEHVDAVAVIFAIYKGEQLYKVELASQSGGIDLSFSLLGLVIEENVDYAVKLIYCKDIQTIKPVKSYLEGSNEFFVSLSGNDNNVGTMQAPFKSLAKAKTVIAALNDNMNRDIVINLMSGEYKLSETELFTNEHSGSNGHMVIIKGYDKENPPVISGGVKVQGWTAYDNNIWQASVDTDEIRSFYINGIAARRARSKNIFEAEEIINEPNSPYKEDGFSIGKSRFMSFAKPQELELVWELEWVCQRTPVSTITQTDSRYLIYPIQPFWNTIRTLDYAYMGLRRNEFFFVENAMEVLDEPGEFYYNKDSNTLYYYPFNGENPNNCETYYADTELLLNASGENTTKRISNIMFDNIIFRYGACNQMSATGVFATQADKLNDANITNSARDGRIIPSQFTVTNAENIIIQNCRFESLGSGAISMTKSVSNAKITGNVISDTSGTGLIIGSWDNNIPRPGMKICTNIEVSNNVFRRNSTEYRGGTAISMYYANSVSICHNDIKETPYSGISLGWGWGEPADGHGNNDISYNRIEDVMCTLTDGGHIYSLGPMRDSVISNNYLKKSSDKYYGGIYFDSGSVNTQAFKNAILESNIWYLGAVGGADPLVVHNNYADTKKWLTFGENNTTVDESILIDPQQSFGYERLIKENAGVELEYKPLLDTVENIAYTKATLTSPHIRYVNGYLVEAEDFMVGGEGVGYHKNQPGNPSNLYRDDDVDIYATKHGNYLVGNISAGEWLKYEVYIDEAGNYKLDARVNIMGETTMVKVYIDDAVLPNETITLPISELVSQYIYKNLGTFNLSRGSHTFRLEFDNWASFDCFTITK